MPPESETPLRQVPSGAVVVIPESDGDDPQPTSHGGVGRKSKFKPDEDLIIVREVAAARAHVAPNGETRERFEVAAAKVNGSKRLVSSVTWKSVQDRYKRLQKRFDRNDRIEAAMSGVGGEFGELEELLSSMKETREDLTRERESKRQKVMEREAEKERLGSELRCVAINRRVGNSGAGEVLHVGVEVPVTGEGSEVEDANQTPRMKKRKLRDPFKDDMERFAALLSDGDKMRIEVDKERIGLERERLEMEKKERDEMRRERELEREERRSDMKESSRLELEKFKLMMGVFRDAVGGAKRDEPSKEGVFRDAVGGAKRNEPSKE